MLQFWHIKSRRVYHCLYLGVADLVFLIKFSSAGRHKQSGTVWIIKILCSSVWFITNLHRWFRNISMSSVNKDPSARTTRCFRWPRCCAWCRNISTESEIQIGLWIKKKNEEEEDDERRRSADPPTQRELMFSQSDRWWVQKKAVDKKLFLFYLFILKNLYFVIII